MPGPQSTDSWQALAPVVGHSSATGSAAGGGGLPPQATRATNAMRPSTKAVETRLSFIGVRSLKEEGAHKKGGRAEDRKFSNQILPAFRSCCASLFFQRIRGVLPPKLSVRMAGVLSHAAGTRDTNDPSVTERNRRPSTSKRSTANASSPKRSHARPRACWRGIAAARSSSSAELRARRAGFPTRALRRDHARVSPSRLCLQRSADAPSPPSRTPG